ncbi:MAG: diaminopimelate epimerase [Pseudomonadota bacterium]
MTLRFSKMHGLGNDFMVIDAINQNFRPRAELTRQWADRFNGIGFDQMLVVEKPSSSKAAFRYRIYNSDGGEVSQCGNGARCFARFVLEQGLTELEEIPVETNAGLLKLERIDETLFRVNMGVPLFEPKEIPLRASERLDQYSVEDGGREFLFSALSIGNPHMVMQVADVAQAEVETLGPFFESHEIFPERANIGFMQIVDRESFNLRVFERGVGETRACGSGACAAMVAGVQLGMIENTATATLLGGKLKLEWQGGSNPVMMTGETAMVYHGEIEYE